MRYLLDSDIIIDYLRGFKSAITKLEVYLTERDRIFVSAVTMLELHAGESITDPKILKQVADLFQQLEVVDITVSVAAQAGDFRRIYKIGVPDALIAASACSVQATLITRNLKHFLPVKEIQTKNIF